MVLGILIGYGSLVKPIVLLLPVMPLIVWCSLGLGFRAIGYTALLILLMGVVITPWMIRNYRVLGDWVPISTNSGYVLYHGSNPESHGLWSQQKPAGVEQETDPIKKDHIYRQAALRWIRENPWAWCKLMVIKQSYMWGTDSTNIGDAIRETIPPFLQSYLRKGIKFVLNGFWSALLVLVFLGTLRTRVWQNRLAWPLLLLLFYIFALHLLFEVQSRYHIPVISALLLVAAAGLAVVGDKTEKTKTGLASRATGLSASVPPGGPHPPGPRPRRRRYRPAGGPPQ